MKPATPAGVGKADPSLTAVEAMIAELLRLRQAERSKDIKSAYTAAIDRLQGVAYRLAQPRPITIGRPARRSIMAEPEPEPAPPPPAPPQRSSRSGRS